MVINFFKKYTKTKFMHIIWKLGMIFKFGHRNFIKIKEIPF